MTALNQISINEGIPGDALSISQDSAIGTHIQSTDGAGSNALGSSFTDIAGSGCSISSSGNYLLIGSFDFYWNDGDTANKHDVTFEGRIIQSGGVLALGNVASFYAAGTFSQRHVATTISYIALAGGATVKLQARAYKDDGTKPASRATCYGTNSSILAVRFE